MSRRTVLIADDHAILREGLKALLSSVPDLEVIGEASDGREAINLARLLTPDLVLMDLTMPHTNGTEAISAIKRRNPETRIIALTVHRTEEYVRATLDGGADGYVLKDDNHDELIAAIRHVLANRTYLSPSIAGNIVNGFLSRRPTRDVQSRTWDSLTTRERQILKLVAEGLKNREIAEYLSVSLKTVEKHRSNLMRKLDLHNASALTAFAIENNLVSS
jgi:DNA-binding NarL/FixJ family response regulator